MNACPTVVEIHVIGPPGPPSALDASWILLKDYGVIGDGTTDDTAALAAADAAAVAAGKTVLVFDQVVRITADTTLAADYVFTKGGRFSIDAGVTLTLNGGIEASDHQIFTGAGTIAGTFDGDPVKPEWWGVPDDGVTAGDATMLAAINAAAGAGVVLEGQPFRRYVFATPNNRINPTSGAKTFRWKNIELYSASTTDGPIIEIRPDAGPALATLIANAAVRDHQCTVNSDAALTVGNRYILISKAFYKASSGDYSNKSEYVTLQSKAAGLLTFYDYLRTSFAVADNSTIFNAQYDIQIELENVTVRRLGGTAQRDGIWFWYSNIRGMRNARGYATGVYAYLFKSCTFEGQVDGQCHESPGGYGFGTSGCDSPKFGNVTGSRMRHLMTIDGDRPTAGKSWNIGGTDVAATGRDGFCSWCHCDDAENAVFDMHPGHFGFEVGGVSGNIRADAPTINGVVLECPDISIGEIDIRGVGVVIQFYGKAADETPPFYSFGSIRVFANPTTSNTHLLSVQNWDDIGFQPININVDMMEGDAGGLVSLDTDVTSGTRHQGGGINLTFGALNGRAWFKSAVSLLPGENGACSMHGQRADIWCYAVGTGAYAISASGAAYQALHPGVPGTRFSIQEGSLYRVDPGANYSMIQCIDSRVDLGRNVTWSGSGGAFTATLDTSTGIGGVSGADKVLKTIGVYATTLTLTPRRDAEEVLFSGFTMTGNTALTLATVGVQAGARFRLTRTTAGAFNITHTLKNIAANQWAEFRFDGAAWWLAAFGAL